MRIVFAGTPTVALPALSALLDSPRHEVVAVLTRPDAPSGRGRRLTASPVAPKRASPIPPRYRSAEESDVTVLISQGDNDLTIQLK